ncbi:putative secreted protein (Por secretion system target) [Marinoscillum furvescens DSM 4134]|uniref:Putative secreted protein (Por secretion system target) n=2 Tax=Marinoscillum furvescens TaxID=1026 RepID=A0A3D9LFS0_MARFU|nr:putative secreted protein (Por secretion system target) [Marinoscillum furvescens DSM 4134]
MKKMKKVLLAIFVVGTTTVSAQKFEETQVNDSIWVTIMEAESYDPDLNVAGAEGFGFLEDNTLAGFSGDFYMAAPSDVAGQGNAEAAMANSPKMGYSIKFNQTGTHYVWVLASSADHSSDDSWHIGVNDSIRSQGMEYMGYRGVAKETDVWIWTRRVNDNSFARFDVAEVGIDTFQIYMREPNAKIDKIIITNHEDYIPYDSTNLQGGAETLYIEPVPLNAQTRGTAFGVYPNPLASAATISFELDYASPVNVVVYNMSGQAVKHLLNDKMTKGRHEITWDGSNNYGASLPNGAYIIQLEKGGVREFRRVAISR